ncbi:MAG: tRNA (adenosine(37)-N6)-dimethylallyltransferase MiaA [Proteobacteria bacterium]|nr:tRNA (adenosine(37)-N6)-dimethylallyltransferase MiaA [Pseudomonadota bacterium]
MPLPPLIAVIGPTASGKTKLGIQLAQMLNAEIISADSMQIFRRMDIGTAKPTKSEQLEIVHHLIDILEPTQSYNAGLFAQDAENIAKDIKSRGKNTILLGGTNLYLKALIHGIIDVPDTSHDVDQMIKLHLREKGVRGCHQWLSEVDSRTAAKLHPNDIARVVRALEVYLTTGNSIQDFHKNHGFSINNFKVFYIGYNFTRDELYSRINQRVDKMFEQGFISEVKSLLSEGLSSELQSMKSIGYKQVISYISGKFTYQEMIDDIKIKSRRYAKKQLTWLKKTPDIHFLSPDYDDWSQLMEQIKQYIKA